MRAGKKKPSKGETTFKAYKTKNNQEKKTNEELSNISDEEVSNFMKKLKRGTGKYKGKFPLICFNCGKIGHFTNNFPYPKHEENDDEINFKDQKKRKNKDKRILYKKK
jgi:6-phosphogluconolactonase/glucosamine-6-phosphate isomerase/deaminase